MKSEEPSELKERLKSINLFWRELNHSLTRLQDEWRGTQTRTELTSSACLFFKDFWRRILGSKVDH